jgi:hypothetical protein
MFSDSVVPRELDECIDALMSGNDWHELVVDNKAQLEPLMAVAESILDGARHAPRPGTHGRLRMWKRVIAQGPARLLESVTSLVAGEDYLGGAMARLARALLGCGRPPQTVSRRAINQCPDLLC